MRQLKNFLKKRIDRFREAYFSEGMDGFIIEDPTDLLYLTGLKVSRGRLLISRESACLFVDGRYQAVAKKEAYVPVKELNANELSAVLAHLPEASVFGYDTALSMAAYRSLRPLFAKAGKKLKGVDDPTLKLRAIKDSNELGLLKKSADLLWKGFKHVQKTLVTGIRERDLAFEFEQYVKKNGAEGLAFDPIIAFGKNSAFPHHHTGDRALKEGEVVLIDIGVMLGGYASDLTRVLFWGQVSKRIESMFEKVDQAYRAALKECRAGNEAFKLDRAAREAFGEDRKYFVHSLGHGVGLNVHEYPRIAFDSKRVKLEEGMVITIEPGLYIPEVGGIRYEDMVVVTKEGYENFFEKTTPFLTYTG